MTQTLPETQELKDVVITQELLENKWGVLYAIKKHFVTQNLTKYAYAVGRAPTCDIVLTKDIVERADVFATISKTHFEIVKEGDIVYLKDCSRNGTHVNGTLVGNGNKVLLQNNDQISMSHPWFKVFVFMKEEASSNDYPEELKQKYVVSRHLGSGAYGDVHLAFHKETFGRYAMKTFRRETFGKNLKDSILNEVRILQRLQHPCIIPLCDMIHTPERVFIFLEFMEGGDLFQRINGHGPLSDKNAKWIFSQIALGLKYLHSQAIAHRDLKPENILLSSYDEDALVKITDFGLSKVFNSHQLLKSFVGSPLYVAPEVLETKFLGSYSNKVDVWSLGAVLYVCLSGDYPFAPNDPTRPLRLQIMTGEYSFPGRKWRGVSQHAIQLIKSMMTVDPKRRATPEEVLAHPWLEDAELHEKLRNTLHIDREFLQEDEENVLPAKRGRYAP